MLVAHLGFGLLDVLLDGVDVLLVLLEVLGVLAHAVAEFVHTSPECPVLVLPR